MVSVRFLIILNFILTHGKLFSISSGTRYPSKVLVTTWLEIDCGQQHMTLPWRSWASRGIYGNMAAFGFDQRDCHTMIPGFFTLIREPTISGPTQYFSVSDFLFEFRHLIVMGDHFTVECSVNDARKLRRNSDKSFPLFSHYLKMRLKFPEEIKQIFENFYHFVSLFYVLALAGHKQK